MHSVRPLSKLLARKRYLVLAGYLAAIHVLAAALLVKVEVVPKVIAKIAMSDARADYAKAMRDHPGVVLLGDSHTHSLGDAAGVTNYGKSGETVAGLTASLRKYPAVTSARAILLMIGTNDIWSGKVAGLPDRYRALTNALPAGIPLVWSGVTPADDFRIDPEDVRAANAAIEALCAARRGCTYVDTHKLLADAHGKPLPAYVIADGVHLSADGYRVWLSALDSALDATAH